jgi:paraquat-inducible protein B
MTDQPGQSTAEVATANVKKKSSGFNPVWVIPIVALLVGGYMVFKNALKDNTRIVVTFKDASGVEAGKTVVKLRDIVIGKVKTVEVAEDLAKITVTMDFPDVPADRFTEKTRFWIVKPRVGLGGVSGLETLLSGAYIEVDPGQTKPGEPVKEFVGLEQPEIYQLGDPGTHYVLKAQSLGSLSRESPIKYRDVEVGQVTRYELAKDNSSVDIDIFIRQPYDKLVKADTRFWNISGLQVDASAAGLKVDLDSVTTLIAGGIAFNTSDLSTGPQARSGSTFNLYKTEKENIEEETEVLAFNVPLKLFFENGVKGLQEGAPAEFKGLRIGTVAKVSIEFSESNEDLRTFAIVKVEPGRLPVEGAYADQPDAERTRNIQKFFEKMAAQGLRAQLQTGNLLTGQSLVVFDFFPHTSPEPMEYVAGMAVFPTMPESLDDIIAKIDRTVTNLNGILVKLDKVPIEEIGNDLAQTMDSINAIPFTRIGNDLAQTMDDINAIPITEIGENLATTSARIEALPYEQITTKLDQTLANLDALIESLNAAKGGALGMQTLRALDEITRAASALRGMADYLERHPEALLRGKKGP